MSEDKKLQMPVIGTVTFKDLEGYAAFWKEKNYAWVTEQRKTLPPLIYPIDRNYNGKIVEALKRWLYEYWSMSRETDEYIHEQVQKKANEQMAKLREAVYYSETYNQPFIVRFIFDFGAYITLGQADFFIFDHEKFLSDICYPKDYSQYTLGELRALAAGANAGTTAPAVLNDSISISQAKDTIDESRSRLAAMKKEAEDLQWERHEELAELKRQADEAMAALRKRKEELMDELARQTEELEEKVEQMNDQIFFLESQIYCIECYLGEAVKFTKIRSGRNAPDTEPVVLYQKLRYLDCEMGRLVSLYELDFSEIKLFEQFLAASPEALEVFAPNDRCVTLVRLSQTSIEFGLHPIYANMLKEYEKYHGRMVGIIIRNGENIYLGWTDEEKVVVTDDLFLDFTPAETVPSDIPENETERQMKARLKAERARMRVFAKEAVSRVFIFNILQGIVDNSNLLPLPKGEKISKESKYVRFSMADRWLVDNRFGSFTDIVKRCNAQISTGDMLLTTQYLHAEHGQYSRRNDRGRGYADRTHDVSVENCTIYPLNLIEYSEPYTVTDYQFRMNGANGEYWVDSTTKGDGSNLSEDTRIIRTYEKRDVHYFVSLEKRWSYFGARANFEVFPDEFINLHCMNSVWLTYAVTNRNLGGWCIGGKVVDYAYAVRYLKTALDFIRKREEEEKRILDEVAPGFTDRNPEWPVALSEWKLEKKARSFTLNLAKRFVKWTQEKK